MATSSSNDSRHQHRAAGSFSNPTPVGTHYEGAPKRLDPTIEEPEERTQNQIENVQHYCSGNKCNCQQNNIKPDGLYHHIEATDNRWIQLACEEAVKSVEADGGPFAAVLLQIDDETSEVIRYWCERNQVTAWNDPTAHAEVNVIRAACKDLGRFHLDRISKCDPNLNLPQTGATSHCQLYSSCEPCPMCYCAIRWARIDTIVFAATRFDAAEPGVDFSDLKLYEELAATYEERLRNGLQIFQATTANSLDAFNLWKNTNNVTY